VKDAINRTIQRAFADAGVDLALPVRPVPVDDRRS